MKKLVIFDLDGTLLDTIRDLGMSANYALEKAHLPTHPLENYPRMVGNGIEKLIERSLPKEHSTREEVLRLKPFFMEYYNAHHADFTRPYPGISEILKMLHREEVLLAVASNKYEFLTRSLVSKFFNDIPFVSVLGQREGNPIKPDPNIVYTILSQARVEKDEVLYIGDSGVDLQTAKNSGVTFLGVTWGFRPRAELETLGATHLADTAEELLQLIQKFITLPSFEKRD